MKFELKRGQSWIHWVTGDVCTVLVAHMFYVRDSEGHPIPTEVVVVQGPDKPKYAEPNNVMVWGLPQFFQAFRAIVHVKENGELL